MALQIWLPLTKDLRQQGLANTSAITLVSGNSLITGGKVGDQCLALTKLQTILGNSSCMTNKKQMSYAYWVKVNTAWSTNWLDGIRWISSDGTTNSINRQEFYTNCTKVGTWFSSNSTNSISGKDFTPEIWTHLAATFDYDTGDVSFYINGVLQGHVTTLNTTHYCRGDFYIGDNGVDISMNDVRIYDHCLSPMEVKELAKGLILHYPLNRQGWGQENLLTKQISDAGWSNWHGTSAWATENTREKIIIDGKLWAHVHQLSSSSYGGYTIAPSNNGIVIDSTKRYTWSCLAKAGNDTNAEIVLWHHWRSTNGGANLSQSIKKFILTSIPTRISWTVPQYINETYTVDRINLMMGTAGTANNEIYFTDVKFEEGEIATPWCPNSSDALATTMGLNSTTEYDCSGFCNNGTWHGTHTNTSDTPKYAVSTTATGSRTTYLEGPVLPAEAKTVALWIKNTSKSSNGAIFNDKTSGLQIGLLNSLLYMNSKASTASFTTTHWVNGEWNHVVAINNDGTRSLYVNGQPETQSGASNYYTHNADNCWLWNRSYNNNYPFTGSLCDLRVYATALSADDVKSLYESNKL